MRSLEFEILPAIGPDTQRTSGTIEELLQAVPYFLMSRLIPPFEVVQSVLRKGLADAGMSGGCRWKAFEITRDEYDELVRAWLQRDFKAVDTPEWVKNRNDWVIWEANLLRGVPVDEHRRLTAEYEALDRQQKEARANADIDRADELFVEAVRAGNRLNDFVMSHLTRDRA